MKNRIIRYDPPENAYYIIPALNEEESLPIVLSELIEIGVKPSRILVIDNGSTDGTTQVARDKKTVVLWEPNRGYGSACLTAVETLKNISPEPEYIVFVDGDGSDDLDDLENLFRPFHQDPKTEFVIGSRTRGGAEKGSLSFLQRFGNRLSCFLLRFFYAAEFTDLGPFRILRWRSFLSLDLKDKTWGWNLEMQIRAVRKNLKIVEVPVRYELRKGGKSKISGNWIGSLRAGAKILWIFFYLTFLSIERKPSVKENLEKNSL
ncbi:glycosyltransferase [Leptospira fletcheri]|uniref:Glycosyltransferase n=1 Tax=Leptospira fletcheri TaxID=2484981 RepID=A0A4R9GF57_9LEPT|nr:glycosyltransferase family 2 protein [Leptospira fletcheri]TGK10171.1 glycosyltransferase [Leptospira fletcheri]